MIPFVGRIGWGSVDLSFKYLQGTSSTCRVLEAKTFALPTNLQSTAWVVSACLI